MPRLGVARLAFRQSHMLAVREKFRVGVMLPQVHHRRHGGHQHRVALEPGRRRTEAVADGQDHGLHLVSSFGRHQAPVSSSISIRRLYFSRRSLRESEPVLMKSAFTATARSAMKVSAVSPERCETDTL